jgi:hypothetical protein
VGLNELKVFKTLQMLVLSRTRSQIRG